MFTTVTITSVLKTYYLLFMILFVRILNKYRDIHIVGEVWRIFFQDGTKLSMGGSKWFLEVGGRF